MKTLKTGYSAVYRKLLDEALPRFREAGLQRMPTIDSKTVSDRQLAAAGDLLEQKWQPYRLGLPEYAGNLCAKVSTQLFIWLNSQGVNADIVVGTVVVRGRPICQCTVESLIAEAKNPGSNTEGVNMHVWVSLGDDTIFDGTLPNYLAEKFNAPPQFRTRLNIGRAADFAAVAIEYRPVIVGSEFIGLTNPPDPLQMLETLKQR